MVISDIMCYKMSRILVLTLSVKIEMIFYTWM